MRRFISNILLFSSGFLLFVIFLFCRPLNKEFAYHFIKKDCADRASWTYNRIFKNLTSIDIAFLGSSHILQGVNDSLIEEQLQLKNMNCNIVNLGHCRFGTDFYFVLLKDMIKVKKVKKLILEVREDEDHYSHPMFPYLADANDILCPVLFFNKNLISNVYNGFIVRLENLKYDLFRTKNDVFPLQLNNHLYWNDNSKADEQILQKAKKERIIKAQNKYSNFERNFYMRFPRKYLQKIARLAKINHIELNFLYIPEYGSPYPLSSEYETYKKYGKVWIPPVNIFEKSANWIDDGHLNIAGSNELSMWLATEILN